LKNYTNNVALAIFIQINNEINSVLGYFKSFKKGNYEGAAKVIPITTPLALYLYQAHSSHSSGA
jgi:hypothetical protein